MRKTKMSILSDYELKKMLTESISIREVLGKIGYNLNGSGGYSQLKNECKRRNIDIPNYTYYGDSDGIQKRRDDKDIFCENSSFSRQHLKERIIKNNLIIYKCEKCENEGEWKGEKLSLQLEHKNGVNDDNRLENLGFLCPNCHSQTDTFSGKSCNKNKNKMEV